MGWRWGPQGHVRQGKGEKLTFDWNWTWNSNNEPFIEMPL